MEQTGQNRGGQQVRFGAFFFSIRPNGYIGCLEYLILIVIGWFCTAAASVLFMFIFGITWGISFVAAGTIIASHAGDISPAAAYAEGAGSVFSLLMMVIGVFCLIAAAALFLLFNARLLQLRLIDIGLGDMLSVPGLGSNFSACLLAVIVCSFINILGFALLVFCCVCQGKTYRDNRDVFAPIAPVPPPDELARQMHARKAR